MTGVHKITQVLTKILQRSLNQGWLQVRLQAQAPNNLEDQKSAHQRLSMSRNLAMQLIHTIWSHLERNRLSEGFSRIEDRSSRMLGVKALLDVVHKLSTSRGSSLMQAFRAHSKPKQTKPHHIQGLQQLISTIKSQTRRAQQTAFRTLSLQPLHSQGCPHCSTSQSDAFYSPHAPEPHHPVSPRRKKGPAVRSSSLAREVSRRVLAGLHRLQRLFVCCTLEPFR